MRSYESLDWMKKSLVHSLGAEFYSRHENHIDLLLEYQFEATQPRMDDMFNPQAWDASNWKWFFSEKMKDEYHENFRSRAEIRSTRILTGAFFLSIGFFVSAMVMFFL